MLNINSKILKHSLKTPLNALLLNIEDSLEILEENSDDQVISSNLKIALKSAKYIKSILDCGTLKRSDENFSVNSTLRNLNDVINQGLKIDTKIINFCHHPVIVKGNAILFKEALTCLINNAYEAYQSKQVKKIKIIIYQRGNYLRILIKDYACGLNLFEKMFYQLKGISGKKNHSGLGLHLAKKIITKNFQGKFKIWSKKRTGTTIQLDLIIDSQSISKTSHCF